MSNYNSSAPRQNNRWNRSDERPRENSYKPPSASRVSYNQPTNDRWQTVTSKNRGNRNYQGRFSSQEDNNGSRSFYRPPSQRRGGWGRDERANAEAYNPNKSRYDSRHQDKRIINGTRPCHGEVSLGGLLKESKSDRKKRKAEQRRLAREAAADSDRNNYKKSKHDDTFDLTLSKEERSAILSVAQAIVERELKEEEENLAKQEEGIFVDNMEGVYNPNRS